MPIEQIKVVPLKFALANWLRVVIGDVGGAVIGITMGPVGIVTGAIGTSIVVVASLN